MPVLHNRENSLGTLPNSAIEDLSESQVVKLTIITSSRLEEMVHSLSGEVVIVDFAGLNLESQDRVYNG